MTTIAGPVGEDEEELGEDIDVDDEEDQEEMEDCSDESEQLPNQEFDILEMTDSDDESNEDCNDENSYCDIDSDLGLSRILPRSLSLIKQVTPVKENPNLSKKQMFSPKLASKLKDISNKLYK